jgi:TolB-like protein/Tfp pilus assembly protein PilF
VTRAVGPLPASIAAILAGGAYFVVTVVAPPAMRDSTPVAPRVGEAAWVTVTVSPFEALAPGGDEVHLARGISDDLSTDLSRVPGLRLIRANSAQAAAAAAASARYNVSGTVQRDGDALRISVFLVDTATHEQLWAGRFERPYRDLFAVQDEVTRKVLDVLPAKVGETERRRAAKRYTHSLAAYDAFQRAQAAFLVRSSADNGEARALYLRAIELDPKFARAYASLALTYAMEYRLGTAAAPSRALDRAFELAETARQIDPDIPQVYWALGFVYAQGRRHAKASQALERAIELDPSYADAYALLGGIRTYVGQPAESIRLLRTAMRLNPDGGYLYYLLLGRAYLFEDDVEQALINLHEASRRNPVDIETRVFLAAALAATGDLAGARWQADEIRSLQPAFSAGAWLDTYPMTSTRQRERLLALLGNVPL